MDPKTYSYAGDFGRSKDICFGWQGFIENVVRGSAFLFIFIVGFYFGSRSWGCHYLFMKLVGCCGQGVDVSLYHMSFVKYKV